MAESIGLSDDEQRFLLRMKAAGWTMVPIEPTEFMTTVGDAMAPGVWREVWDAMIVHAPPLGRHVE